MNLFGHHSFQWTRQKPAGGKDNPEETARIEREKQEQRYALREPKATSPGSTSPFVGERFEANLACHLCGRTIAALGDADMIIITPKPNPLTVGAFRQPHAMEPKLIHKVCPE